MVITIDSVRDQTLFHRGNINNMRVFASNITDIKHDIDQSKAIMLIHQTIFLGENI